MQDTPMSKGLYLEIVTPDRLVLGLEVVSVTAPGVAGEFTVLPLHIPFLSSLQVGSVVYRTEGQARYVFLSGGIAEVLPHKVLMLAQAAERSEEIDVERARKAQERAAARLAAEKQENIDYVRAKAALQRAILRIKLHELTPTGLGQLRSGRH